MENRNFATSFTSKKRMPQRNIIGGEAISPATYHVRQNMFFLGFYISQLRECFTKGKNSLTC